MQKGGYFDIFECPRRIFHFSWKRGLYFKKRTYASPTEQCYSSGTDLGSAGR